MRPRPDVIIQAALAILIAFFTSAATCAPMVGTHVFSTLTYSQHGAEGFCPREDSVYNATITKLDDGNYQIEMDLLVLTPETGDDVVRCDAPAIDVNDGPCGIGVEQPTRLLTAEELQRVKEVLAALELEWDPGIPDGIAIDPCRVERLVVDGEEYALAGVYYSEPRFVLTDDSRQSVIDLVESLR